MVCYCYCYCRYSLLPHNVSPHPLQWYVVFSRSLRAKVRYVNRSTKTTWESFDVLLRFIILGVRNRPSIPTTHTPYTHRYSCATFHFRLPPFSFGFMLDINFWCWVYIDYDIETSNFRYVHPLMCRYSHTCSGNITAHCGIL
jgi:hypothetical protein